MRKLFASELALVAGGSGGSITVLGERSDTSSTFTWSSETTATTSTTSTSLNDTALGFEDGGGTLEEQAREFSENAVVRGEGFDPSNPKHLEIEKLAKEAIEKAFLKLMSGSDAKITTSTGLEVADDQMRGLLDGLQIYLHADPSGDVANYLHGNPPTIDISLEHDQIDILTGNFGSLEEVVNWIVAHELGHRIDILFGDGIAPSGDPDRTNEDDANIVGYQLLEALGLSGPSLGELQGSYIDFQHEPQSAPAPEEPAHSEAGDANSIDESAQNGGWNSEGTRFNAR